MSVIEGNEFLLRHLTKQDLQDFTVLVTDPLYGKYSPLGRITEEAAELMLNNIVANYDSNQYEFWVVMDKEYNSLAGFVGYHPILFENKRYEMYFVGFYTKYWGSKFPEQASQYACNYALNQRKIPQLIAFVHPDDTAALMCTQILDAKFEREAKFFGATLFLFSINQTDFKPLQIGAV